MSDAQVQKVDVAIVGGGMVGLSLATLLSQANPAWTVVLVDQVAFPAVDAPLAQPSFDARSTAIAHGSVELFSRLGIWPALANVATPIHTVSVSDKGHFLGASITAAERGLAAVGYVVPNAALGQALLTAARQVPNLQLLGDARVSSVAFTADAAQLDVAVGANPLSLAARLCVVADGGDSPLRDQVGIHQRRRDYGQTAIVCNVGYTEPHQGVAYERFTDTGPLALLPLGGARGRESALIWTLPHDQAQALLQADDAHFLEALQARFGARLGAFTRVSTRSHFALSLLQSEEQIRSRLVLIGNAAHYLHPVAGQGFNLSLRDCAALTETLVQAAGDSADIGTLAVMNNYLTRQASDQFLTVEFSHYLVKLFSSDFMGAIAARHLGLLSLEFLPPLKRELVAQTMGSAGRRYQLGELEVQPARNDAAPDVTHVAENDVLVPDTFDVVIVGAGLVGASAACAIVDAAAKAGRTINLAVIEPALTSEAPIAAAAGQTGFDPRVVALNPKSEQLLRDLGVWDAVTARGASPYTDMYVWDGAGSSDITFSAAEAGITHLGHIVENRVLVDALRSRMRGLSGIHLLADKVVGVDRSGDNASPVVIELASGRAIHAQLLIAADGARSPVRDMLGFKTREWDYGHCAIVTTVRTRAAHQATAWQKFMPTGPLAFLPLHADGAQFHASIVWSLNEDLVDAVMGMSDAEFCRELTRAFDGKLGEVEHADKRHAIKLRQCHAVDYVLPHVALIGDAAHAIHPLAGQGVNLGLADVIALRDELARGWSRSLPTGDYSILRRYQRARMGENLAMMAGMEGFKYLFAKRQLPVMLLRNWGMAGVNRLGFAKKWIVKYALGRV